MTIASRAQRNERRTHTLSLLFLFSLFFDVARSFTKYVCLPPHSTRTCSSSVLNLSSPLKHSESSSRNDQEWKFFDTARLHVTGGDGGNGCVAFRREKGEPRGGPSGGRGGSGGDVYLVCNPGLNTLAPVRNSVHIKASKGLNGLGKNKDGACGKDKILPVPPGTVIRDLSTGAYAGELSTPSQKLLVARGGRGGRGNAAFMTGRNTAPKLAERGEPGAARWLVLELKLVADVGFLGKPNAGKSTILASASAARPKVADYPFTTIVPNLGVCDIGEEGAGLVLCDIPGLIEGAAGGAGLGQAFLRHVQRCKVLLHVIDGTSPDPIQDFITINNELQLYDQFLAQKPQVVVLNKIDVPEVREKQDELLAQLKRAAGHSRVLPISAATQERVSELMGRLKKFVQAQPEPELPPPPDIDFSCTGLETDSDDYEILSDPAYPGQFRISGKYIEQIAKMTHWEYPEAVQRFGRQLDALGISQQLQQSGATDGDLIMVGEFDFEFAPKMTNLYIPPDLLEKDMYYELKAKGLLAHEGDEEEEQDEDIDDVEELLEFDEFDDWDLLEDNEEFNEEFIFNEDEVWTSS